MSNFVEADVLLEPETRLTRVVKFVVWTTCALLLLADLLPSADTNLWRRDVWSFGPTSLGLDHLALLLLVFCALYLTLLPHANRRPSLFMAAIAVVTFSTALCALIATSTSLGEGIVSQRTTSFLYGAVTLAVWKSRPRIRNLQLLLVFAGCTTAAAIAFTELLSGVGPAAVDAWKQSDNWVYSSRSAVAIGTLVLPVAIVAVISHPTLWAKRMIASLLCAAFAFAAAASLVRTTWLMAVLASVVLILMSLRFLNPWFDDGLDWRATRHRAGATLVLLLLSVVLVATALSSPSAGPTETLPAPAARSDQGAIASEERSVQVAAASSDSLQWRFGVWGEVLRDTGPTLMPLTPLTTLRGQPFLGSHNAYVDAYRTFGLLGFVTMLTVMAAAFWRSRHSYFLLIALVSIQVVLVLWDGLVWPWIIVGCALAYRQRCLESTSQSFEPLPGRSPRRIGLRDGGDPQPLN